MVLKLLFRKLDFSCTTKVWGIKTFYKYYLVLMSFCLCSITTPFYTTWKHWFNFDLLLTISGEKMAQSQTPFPTAALYHPTWTPCLWACPWGAAGSWPSELTGLVLSLCAQHVQTNIKLSCDVCLFISTDVISPPHQWSSCESLEFSDLYRPVEDHTTRHSQTMGNRRNLIQCTWSHQQWK